MFLWHLALAQASPEGVPKEGLYVHICWNSFNALATYQQGPRQVTSRTCPWTIWRRSHGPAAQSRYRSSSLRMVIWCIPQGEECGAYDEASWHFSTSSFFCMVEESCQCHLHSSCRLITPTGTMTPRSPKNCENANISNYCQAMVLLKHLTSTSVKALWYELFLHRLQEPNQDLQQQHDLEAEGEW